MGDAILYNGNTPIALARQYGRVWVTMPYHDAQDEDPVIDDIIEDYIKSVFTIADIVGKQQYRISKDEYTFYLGDYIASVFFFRNLLLSAVGMAKVDPDIALANEQNMLGRLFNTKTPSLAKFGTNNMKIIEQTVSEKIEALDKSKYFITNPDTKIMINVISKLGKEFERFKKAKNAVNKDILVYLVFHSNINMFGIIPYYCTLELLAKKEECDKIFREVDNKYDLHPERQKIIYSSRTLGEKMRDFGRDISSTYNPYAESLGIIVQSKGEMLYESVSIDNEIDKPLDLDDYLREWDTIVKKYGINH